MMVLIAIRDRVRPGFLFATFIILFCIFFTTYSARFQSGDTAQVFDAINSLALFGDLGRDESLRRDPPQFQMNPSVPYFLSPYELDEAATVYVGAMLYQVIRFIPTVGLIHGVYLLNIIVTALVGVMIVIVARQLGYVDKIAFIAALLFGLCTVAWWYSKTLFREPLVMLELIILMSLILHWKQNYKQLWVLPIMLLIGYFAFKTKQSSVFAFIGLCVLALPTIKPKWITKIINWGLIASIALLTLVALAVPIMFYTGALLDFRHIALYGYLLSPGGSLWGTSPILLLSLTSIPLLIKQHQQWWWGCLLIILGYIVGHALFTGEHWFGGLSAPPRFLVPILPLAMLLTLPALNWLFDKRRYVIWYGCVALLVAYSISVQLITNVSFTTLYQDLLPDQSLRLFEWLGGLTDPRYFRWVLLPQTWGSIGYDTAWHRIALPMMYTIFVTIGVMTAILLYVRRSLIWLSLILLIVTVGYSFNQLYHYDGEHRAQNEALFEVLDILTEQGRNGEPLVLSSPVYESFLMNYSDLSSVRPIVFGYQQGEAVSASEPARVTSTYTPSLLEIYVPSMLDVLSYNHGRIWLLVDNSEFLDFAVRPMERYLNDSYYLLREYRTDDPTVRLLLYDTTRAPQTGDFRLAHIPTETRFGENIALTGITLPHGIDYQSGDVVPFSLFWETDTQLSNNYVVATFIMKSDLSFPIIEGINSQPNNGFAPTTTWQPNIPIIDNRAIQLPNDMPYGDYQLWIVLYDVVQGGDARLPMTQGDDVDGTIAVMPLTLKISIND